MKTKKVKMLAGALLPKDKIAGKAREKDLSVGRGDEVSVCERYANHLIALKMAAPVAAKPAPAAQKAAPASKGDAGKGDAGKEDAGKGDAGAGE